MFCGVTIVQCPFNLFHYVIWWKPRNEERSLPKSVMHVQRFFFFFCLWNLSVFYSYLLSRRAATYSQPLLQKQSFLSIMTTTKSCSFTQDKNTNKAAITKATWGFLDISEGEQGAKKIIFTACHSSKLKLASTSPDVISNSPKSF